MLFTIYSFMKGSAKIEREIAETYEILKAGGQEELRAKLRNKVIPMGARMKIRKPGG